MGEFLRCCCLVAQTLLEEQLQEDFLALLYSGGSGKPEVEAVSGAGMTLPEVFDFCGVHSFCCLGCLLESQYLDGGLWVLACTLLEADDKQGQVV